MVVLWLLLFGVCCYPCSFCWCLTRYSCCSWMCCGQWYLNDWCWWSLVLLLLVELLLLRTVGLVLVGCVFLGGCYLFSCSYKSFLSCLWWVNGCRVVGIVVVDELVVVLFSLWVFWCGDAIGGVCGGLSVFLGSVLLLWLVLLLLGPLLLVIVEMLDSFPSRTG